MMIPAWLRRASLALRTTVLVRALLAGVAAWLLVITAATLGDMVLTLPLAARGYVVAIAWISAIVTVGVLAVRGGILADVHDAALWLEERVPTLGYRLVSAVDPWLGGRVPAPPAPRWSGLVAHAAVDSLAVPASLTVGALLILSMIPGGVRTRALHPTVGDAISASPAPAAATSHLSPLVVDVVPPAYARMSSRTLDEPGTVEALVGSRIAVRGRGSDVSIAATIVGDSARAALPVTKGDDRWTVSTTMPARPSAVRLVEGRRDRLVVLVPRIDSAPSITLRAPVRDTVLRNPTGTIAIAADARDDIGLAQGWIEYIVSSGEGESFTFRSGVLGKATFNSARSASVTAALSLSALALKAGDVLHVRAVAFDANNVSGAGKGTSETRVIRIARLGEYDSVAVEGAPPPEADKSLVSERMLIMLAEALEKKRPKLERAAVVSESRRIGSDQKRLRRTVGEIVFSRLGGKPSGEEVNEDDDRALKTPEEVLAAAEASANGASDKALDFEGEETPVVAVNRPLLEAYNAMWDAGRELDVGEPGRALPHMRAALAALQRARAAERIYLRGRPPAVVVDVPRVRLAGGESNGAAARSPRTAISTASSARIRRLTSILGIVNADAGAAIDSLLALRVDALGDLPSLAAALDAAADALRMGKDATAALSRARRLAAGAPIRRDSIPAWSGAW